MMEELENRSRAMGYPVMSDRIRIVLGIVYTILAGIIVFNMVQI